MKDRYPGLREFDKDESGIFFGRDMEIEELYDIITLEKIVVLFGKSGLGKSSLLNAGMYPLFIANNFLPVRIRLNSGQDKINFSEQESPLDLFLQSFRPFIDEKKIITETSSPRLWEYLKASTFPFNKNIEKNALPVFIFDQFEEFFYYPQHIQNEFLVQLSEIVHEQPPNRILQWITNISADKRTSTDIEWHKQPEVKVVFAIRSDKLSLFQSIVSFIPTVLNNRYELKPLNRKKTYEAIEKPAIKILNGDYLKPFSYDKNILRQIVNELSDPICNEIESSQLQMVCGYIEDKITHEIESGNLSPENLIVTESIIKPQSDIRRIRDDFYEEQIKLIPNEEDQKMVKKVIEDDMIIDGSRAGLLEKQILKKIQEKKNLLEILIKARLLRIEITNLGPTYEISHDTLVESIEKSRQKRIEYEKNRELEEENQRLAKEQKLHEAEILQKQKLIESEQKLKEFAIQRENEAIAQKEKAEQLEKEAIASKELANEEKMKAVHALNRTNKLRKINRYLSLTVFSVLAIFIGVLYLRNKVNDKQIAKIFNYEALKRFNAGDRMMAHEFLEKSNSYEKEDSVSSANWAKKIFSPFGGGDVGVSGDEKFVGTRYANGRFILWDVSGEKNIIDTVRLENIKKFSFLTSQNLYWTTDSGLNFQLYSTSGLKDPRFLNMNSLNRDSFEVSEVHYLEKSGLLLLPDRRSKKLVFIRISDCKKLDVINTKINNLLNGEFKDLIPNNSLKNFQDALDLGYVKLTGADFSKAIVMFHQNKSVKKHLFCLDLMHDVMILTKPINSEKNEVVFDPSYKLIAYESDGFLTIDSITNVKGNKSSISLKGNYKIQSFASNNTEVIVSFSKLPNYSIYVYNLKNGSFNILSNIYGREINFIDNAHMLFINSTDSLLCCYNFDKHELKKYEIKLSEYRILGNNKIRLISSDLTNHNNVYDLETDNNFNLLEKQNLILSTETKENYFPLIISSEKFYKYFDRETNQSILVYKDSSLNNIEKLHLRFQNYLNKELKKFGAN